MARQFKCTCGEVRYSWAGYKQHTRVAHNLRLRMIQGVKPEIRIEEITAIRNQNLTIQDDPPKASEIAIPTPEQVARIVQ